MTANTPQSKKSKGRAFQQEVVQDIVGNIDGVYPEDVLSRSMGAQGCDIMLSKVARALFPYGLECKRTERINVWEAWEQASANAFKENLTPLLLIRRNRGRTLAVIDWTTFIGLVERANLGRKM